MCPEEKQCILPRCLMNMYFRLRWPAWNASVMATPCNGQGKVNPAVLVAAKEAGREGDLQDRRCPGGGSHGLWYGNIPKVDKIVGPGNIYVALAKKAVYGS